MKYLFLGAFFCACILLLFYLKYKEHNYHWYILTYRSQSEIKSGYIGLKKKNSFTVGLIEKERLKLFEDDNASLINLSYLSRMTISDFNKTKNRSTQEN